MPQDISSKFIYMSILSLFLLIATLFALRVPDWQAPDEPAHYNYIAQVASGDILPIIELGDWDNDYINLLKREDFAPQYLDDLASIQYEDHQPPLYYWFAAPIFAITNGHLFAVRMVSVFFGMLIVALSYAITIEIFPERSYLGLAVMSLVAFLPQNIHILASVNNDALAGVVIAVTLLLCMKYLRSKNLSEWSLGIIIGIAFITKTTTYFMSGVVIICILLRWLQDKGRGTDDNALLISRYMKFAIPASIFAILYWGRNLVVYGFPDFLGLQAHDAVVIGQPRRVDFINQNGIESYWNEAISTTFNSFWGQFGWMEARLGDALPIVLWYITILLILAMIGLIAYFVRHRSKNNILNPPRSVWIELGLVMLLALAQYIYYNLTFVQFQGRYIFVAIIPFAIGMVLGIDMWRRWLFGRFAWSKWFTVGLFLIFAPIDLYLIWRVIPCAVGCL